jgi:hypothetical protein
MQNIPQSEADAVQYGRVRYSLSTGDLGVVIYLLGCLRGISAFSTLDVFNPPHIIAQ